MDLKIKKAIYPVSKLSFDDWMHSVVKSSFYTDDEAMSRARENLKNYKDGINKTPTRSTTTRT